MDLRPTSDQAAFRESVATWLRDHHPGKTPPTQDEDFVWRREFQRRLFEGGWAGIHWPPEYGGRGAGVVETAIFFEELGRAGCPLPANILGLLLAGPTIMAWGSEEQKRQHLPGILSGDQIFCQCFSEPSAGSDLASVRTTATPVDGGWLVNGQKVWTSFAQYADWALLLARTDPAAPKHHALTYFIVDMKQEGVTPRPLRQITNDQEFNEVFFDDVFVPDAKRLSPVGQGWRVALTTLANERAGIVDFLQTKVQAHLDATIDIVAAGEHRDDPATLDVLGGLIAETAALRLTNLRSLSSFAHSGQPGPEASLVKWMWSAVNQRLTEEASALAGVAGVTAGTSWSHELLRSRGNTIEGGTTDIQKNIIAERVLGLPRG